MEKVLIIDDTKSIRMMLTTCLELRDYEVFTADSGKEALNILERENGQLNLIFLDIRMPEMNGTEVLKHIRDMEIICPVIIMTAFATVKNAIDCTKLGAAAYLQKPFSVDRVNDVIDEVLKVTSDKNTPLLKLDENEYEIVTIAKSLIEKGDYESAHNKLKEALAINPYNKEIYFLLGKVNDYNNNEKYAQRFYTISKLMEDET